MSKANRKIKHFAIFVTSHYFLAEFFVPLIEQSCGSETYTIIIDVSAGVEKREGLIDLLNSLPALAKIIVVNCFSANPLAVTKSLNSIIRSLDEIDLFIASDLASPVMRILSLAFRQKNIPVVLSQTSGLHHEFAFKFWDKDASRSELLFPAGGPATDGQPSRIFKVRRYPSYALVIWKRIKAFLLKFCYTALICPMVLKRFLPRAQFSGYPYLSNDHEHAVMIYPADVEAFKKCYRGANIAFANPPYAKAGNAAIETDLLIAFPSLFSTENIDVKLANFIDIIVATSVSASVTGILVRFHPRQDQTVNDVMYKLTRAKLPNIEIRDVTNELIHDVLPTCKTVVSGVSNLLAVARATSRTRSVVGVLGVGLDGFAGTNIQYLDIGEVAWASTVADLNLAYLTKGDYAQNYNNENLYHEVLRSIAGQ